MTQELSNIDPPLRVGLQAPTVDIKVIKEFEFFRAGSNSYKADITRIEDTTYVALSQWFFGKANQKWNPTKKQIFLTSEGWFELLNSVDDITNTLVDYNPNCEHLAKKLKIGNFESKVTNKKESSSLEDDSEFLLEEDEATQPFDETVRGV